MYCHMVDQITPSTFCRAVAIKRHLQNANALHKSRVPKAGVSPVSPAHEESALPTELWLAPLQVARATGAATFLVAQGWSRYYSKLIAPLVFWPLKSTALIASFIS